MSGVSSIAWEVRLKPSHMELAAVHGPEEEGMVWLWAVRACPEISVPTGAVHGCLSKPQTQAVSGQDLQTCLQRPSCCKCQCSFCVLVHQTGEAPGKEPQTCYMFSCSAMSGIPCTAVAEPVSWGPQGAWGWVNLAKFLRGLNNWNN